MSDTANTDQALTYEGALDRLMGLVDFERSTNSPGHSAFHLERMHMLMDRLGNQHQNVPAIHVAGTKGKGRPVFFVTATRNDGQTTPILLKRADGANQPDHGCRAWSMVGRNGARSSRVSTPPT